MSSRKLLRGAAFFGLVFGASGQSPALVKTGERVESLREDSVQVVRPIVSGYAVLSVEQNRSPSPTLWVVGLDGAREQISVSIPDAKYILIEGIAAGSDRMIVACGQAYSGEFTGSSFLWIVAPDRKKRTAVRLAPYEPYAVTVSPDSVIWTVGFDGAQQNVVRRFSGTGAVLSSSSVKTTGRVNGGGAPGSTMQASSDRVGWLTNTSEYIEFALDGSEIYRIPGPPWHPPTEVFTTFGISAKGRVVASVTRPTQPEPTMWHLDRSSRRWEAVDAAGAGLSVTTGLLGFNGEEIVVRVWGDHGSTLARFALN